MYTLSNVYKHTNIYRQKNSCNSCSFYSPVFSLVSLFNVSSIVGFSGFKNAINNVSIFSLTPSIINPPYPTLQSRLMAGHWNSHTKRKKKLKFHLCVLDMISRWMVYALFLFGGCGFLSWPTCLLKRYILNKYNPFYMRIWES